MGRNDNKFTITSQESINQTERLILYRTSIFFSKSENARVLHNMLNRKKPVSIRLLEWFVINYSKTQGTRYKVDDRGVKRYYHVYNEYRAQMKLLNKEHFDPFCRTHHVECIYRGSRHTWYFETSVGQLNYMYWAIRNGVLVYLQRHTDTVREHMRQAQQKVESSEESEEECPAPREESSWGTDENTVHLDLTATVGKQTLLRRRKKKDTTVETETEISTDPEDLMLRY